MAENHHESVYVLEDPKRTLAMHAAFLLGIPTLGIAIGVFALDEGPIDLLDPEKYGLSEVSVFGLIVSFVYLGVRVWNLPVKQRKERITTWTEPQVVQVQREKREVFWE